MNDRIRFVATGLVVLVVIGLYFFSPIFAVAVSVLGLLALAVPWQSADVKPEQEPDSATESDVAKQISKASSTIAIGSANLSHFLDGVKSLLATQTEQSAQITERVREGEQSTEQISHRIQQANDQTQEATERVNVGLQKINVLNENKDKLGQSISDTHQHLKDLQERTAAISQITSTINTLAEQTNLLALNAAIEAARAGEQGRGFAVVADEVRNLAHKTTDATEGISDVLDKIVANGEASIRSMEQVTENGDIMATAISDLQEDLNVIASTMQDMQQQMASSNDEIRSYSAASGGITENVDSLHQSFMTFEEDLQEGAERVMTLSQETEQVFRLLKSMQYEDRNSQVRDIALESAARIGELFETEIQNGNISQAQLFDKNYQPIANTNPPKHSTQFDSFTDKVLPEIQEPILVEYPHIIYAGAVDVNGYFPTHNKKFSQPLSGDYDKDLVGNRTKRIFDDPTGSRCGSNTTEFLLQTYKRDTGEVMHDLSAPIYVNGQHWGGFRIGYQAEV